VLTLTPPDLDIVVWAPVAGTAGAVGDASRRVFEAAAELDLHLALTRLDPAMVAHHWPHLGGQGDVTCLRCCLMKPEHLEWLDALWALVERALERAVGTR
jgi:hypothetical protein